MTATELIRNLERQGFTLLPLPEGKLAVKPADRLTDALREELKARKAEVVRLLTQERVAAWPCPRCGRPATIEAVEPSLDGERMLTFWQCEPCQTYAVTPDAIREPPKGWGTKVHQ